MKKTIQYIVFVTLVTASSASPVQAQQVSNPATNLPVDPGPLTPSGPYPGLSSLFGPNKYNYVRTQVPDVPSATWPPPSDRYRQTTEYLDGLGRSMQTVAKNEHADNFDIVSQKVYDAGSGKETYTYLPFAAPVSTSNGNLHIPVASRIKHFYDANGPDEEPYSKTETDNSPVNRITKQLLPGRNWVGSNRGKVNDYWCNTAPEGVRIFTIGNNLADVPITNAAYAPFVLYVDQVTDEDGKYSLEYKDKRGLLILKKTRISGTGPAHDGFACTYYVYDNLNRLRYVIPPKAVAAITTSWNVSSVTNLCYSYFYDSKNRVIEKKIADKGTEYYVYDKRNRQVLYRDGNLELAGQWMLTIYDPHDRPISTSIYASSDNRTTLQGYMDDNSAFTAPNLFYYLKNYGPQQEYPGSTTAHMLSYIYYDNYDQIALLDFDQSQFSNITIPPDNSISPPTLSNQVRGLVTGTKVRVEDPESPNDEVWLTSANYYDDKGRVIQVKSQNLKGGIEISSNLYYFQGKLWKNILRHQNPDARPIAGTNDGAHAAYTIYTTNALNLHQGGGNDQIRSMTQKIDGGIEYQFGNYFYDHLGQVVVKQTPAANFLQEYNIRGLLNHIQVANFNNEADSIRLFEENLYYDKGFASKLYNGNIAGITWRKAGTLAPVEAYGYSYDALDRLTHAEYARKNTQNNWVKTAYDYTASNITYDINGNILSMNQRGINPPAINTPINMDQLTYNYAAGSNQLIKVIDAVNPASTISLPDFKDNPNVNHPQEYYYDANGNLVKDENKGIGAIKYGHLNKPETISIDFKGKITNVYDASGNKLQKRVYDKNTDKTDTFDYIGNFVYKNDTLQYITNGEGRARPVANPLQVTKFIYDYFVKDHLGNVRSTVTAKPIDAQYLASYEIAMANVEQLVFDNIANVRNAKPVDGKPGDNMAARLDGGDPARRVGTAIMLQVMPGDRFTISTDAYYEGDYQQSDVEGSQAIIESLMGALLNGNTYAGVPIAELPDNVKTITRALNNPALAGQLENLIQSDNNSNAPRAHLNVLFFNDKLELVPGGSSITQVPVVPQGGSLSGFMTLVPNAQSQYGVGTQQVCCTSPGPGYVIIYVDNQSIGKDVWFDNIMIEHYTGKVQEENHYYPFGLTVQTALEPNHVNQPYKFNGKELEKSFGMETYDFGARIQDPQIGRWFGVDPLADAVRHESQYAYASNNPVKNIDKDGMLTLAYNRQDALDAGVTNEALRTFETVVRNVGNLLNGNPQLMEAMKNTTGWSEDQIKQQLTFGEGATINLTRTGQSQSDATGMTMDINMIKQLSAIDPSDQAAYGKQLFTLALFMLHELGHIGDKQNNGGLNTGQYDVHDQPEGEGRRSMKDVKFDSQTRSDARRSGTQKWHISLTGHRGTDIEVVGFGVKMGIKDDGTADFDKGKFPYYTKFSTATLPAIPAQLPDNAKAENIQSTLGL
ncbi:DUF6443 domain-containing protein [Pedobacter nutrimenti]|uniref:DUF6443 domain-containing protein n=1 Tax=Pedobacter nutrimenti TaxID=1241337 RepID=UPI00292E2C7F|nr:DUF6443 domain-containing protein [Pedobacter nutrimenti]